MKYRIIQHRKDNKFTHLTVEILTKRFIFFTEWLNAGVEFKCLADAMSYVQNTFERRLIVKEGELL